MPKYDSVLNGAAERGHLWPEDHPVQPFPRFNGRPGRLIDATGFVVSPDALMLTACDTETGEVEHADVCPRPDTGPKYAPLPISGRLVTQVTVFPAPLRYVAPEGSES